MERRRPTNTAWSANPKPVIKVVATDRNGHHLGDIIICKETPGEANDELPFAYTLINRKFKDPYIFIERTKSTHIPLTPSLRDAIVVA